MRPSIELIISINLCALGGIMVGDMMPTCAAGPVWVGFPDALDAAHRGARAIRITNIIRSIDLPSPYNEAFILRRGNQFVKIYFKCMIEPSAQFPSSPSRTRKRYDHPRGMHHSLPLLTRTFRTVCDAGS